MQTLTLKNTWKNLTLIAAGALMATMIAVPLAGVASASDTDEHPFIAPPATVTYSIEASNGTTTNFELVERDGKMILVLYEDTTVPFYDPDEE